MVEHTHTISRQFADELFECVWPFCEVGAKRVNSTCNKSYRNEFYITFKFPKKLDSLTKCLRWNWKCLL